MSEAYPGHEVEQLNIKRRPMFPSIAARMYEPGMLPLSHSEIESIIGYIRWHTKGIPTGNPTIMAIATCEKMEKFLEDRLAEEEYKKNADAS